MPPKRLNIYQLTQVIRDYESDTFSATESCILPYEAHLAAEYLLSRWVEQYLDGIAISSVLDDVRS